VILRIGIDLMGGDAPPSLLFDAILEALETSPTKVTFVLYATQEWCQNLSNLHQPNLDQLKPHRPKQQYLRPVCESTVEFHSCSEYITMDDAPLAAVRAKKNSTLLTGLRHLKNGLLDVFISTGNTGALIAGATLLLSKIPGILRPALLTVLPTKKKNMVVLDVGGNVSSTAAQMVQFAFMGVAYASLLLGRSEIRVGLLNVGAESKKGTRTYQEVHAQIDSQSNQRSQSKLPFNFVGNVEGRDVFEGHIDVLVTDGFAGNIFLKTVEGTALFMLELFERHKGIHEHACDQEESLKAFKRRFTYKEYPGALLFGVDGLVIKCHGEGSTRSLINTILNAISLVEMQFLEKAKMLL